MSQASPSQPLPSAPPPPQSPPSKGMTVPAILVGSCFVLAFMGAIMRLGYPGAVLGLCALAGSIAIFRKKDSKHRSAAVIGAIASVIVVFGAVGNGNESSRKAAAMAASIEEARQKAEASRAHEEDMSERIAALATSSAPQEAVDLCNSFGDLRDIPEKSRARCGEAYLAKGRESLAAAKPAEAVPLLERASALAPGNADAATTLSSARELRGKEDFKTQGPEVSAKLARALAHAKAKEWEEAETELNAADATLKAFEGLEVAKSKEWNTLAGQAAQQRKRIQPRLEKLQLQREAQKLMVEMRGEKPVNSSWDGSVPEVEMYLKKVMNDPDSYEHVSSTVPVPHEAYWLVKSTFRGKNAFGGKVLNTRYFFIQQRQVVRMEE
ncbi:transporter [Myxococcus xanthus]|uniref:Transporter n=1 Tax=Myxococcus xanthus TaxID=34 RepID=A0A7Y4IQI8_MYXXA|nr:transporter [Myxococcus xanthus]NOJ83436.1 transporter [Myxococcus xanthus]NOJ90767.1 transporter [Myxococcus xanthus]